MVGCLLKYLKRFFRIGQLRWHWQLSGASYIHNNPAAIDLIKKVVRDFHIDLVIDTGDITDFGTPVETSLIDGISKLPVPYVFVPGNHESPKTVAFMRGVKNVTVLDGKEVDIKGITVIGFADPASANPRPALIDDKAKAALRAQIIGTLKPLPAGPLILAVHNPKAVNGLLGRVPIILVGHTHKADLIERDGFIENNAGTTGAAGLRTSLEVTGTQGEFRLERNLIKGKAASKSELGMLSR